MVWESSKKNKWTNETVYTDIKIIFMEGSGFEKDVLIEIKIIFH